MLFLLILRQILILVVRWQWLTAMLYCIINGLPSEWMKVRWWLQEWMNEWSYFIANLCMVKEFDSIQLNGIEWVTVCRGGIAMNVTQSAHYSITFSLMSWYQPYIIVIGSDNDLELNDKQTTFVLFCGFDLLIIKIHFRVYTFL